MKRCGAESALSILPMRAGAMIASVLLLFAAPLVHGAGNASSCPAQLPLPEPEREVCGPPPPAGCPSCPMGTFSSPPPLPKACRAGVPFPVFPFFSLGLPPSNGCGTVTWCANVTNITSVGFVAKKIYCSGLPALVFLVSMIGFIGSSFVSFFWELLPEYFQSTELYLARLGWHRGPHPARPGPSPHTLPRNSD